MSMKKAFARWAKIIITRVGKRAPRSVLRAVALANGYAQLGRWFTDHGFETRRLVRGRDNVFAAIIAEVGDARVLYTEFGVFEGASLKWFSNALRNPDTELHGFDSFEGLPESFDQYDHPRGQFNRQGKIPEIDDPRVRLHVGWFDETLPKFQIPPHDRLVVTLDADLYSSTALVLDHLSEAIIPGAILYFDELSRVDHEPAAFADFMSRYGRTFEVLALEDTFNTGAFLCTG